jgi:hypothetical protein
MDSDMTTIVVYRYDDPVKGEYALWRKVIFESEKDAVVPNGGDIVVADSQFIEGEAKVVAVTTAVEASPPHTQESSSSSLLWSVSDLGIATIEIRQRKALDAKMAAARFDRAIGHMKALAGLWNWMEGSSSGK